MKIAMILFLSAFSCFAQMDEAYFQYNIEVEAVDNSLQTKQTVAMLRNSKMELYFAKNQTRMDFKMGELSMTSVIIDRNKNKMLSLNESFGAKKAILGVPDEQKMDVNPNVKTIAFKDQKVILGFKCYKFVVIEDSVRTEYWISDEINVNSEDQKILNSNLPGFPVAFCKEEDGIKMSFQLTNTSDHFEASLESVFFYRCS